MQPLNLDLNNYEAIASNSPSKKRKKSYPSSSHPEDAAGSPCKMQQGFAVCRW